MGQWANSRTWCMNESEVCALSVAPTRRGKVSTCQPFSSLLYFFTSLLLTLIAVSTTLAPTVVRGLLILIRIRMTSLSSSEVLTPDIHRTDQSQLHSHSLPHSRFQIQSESRCLQATFSSLPDSTSIYTPTSSTGSGSSVDWSLFEQQKRTAEEGWRKRRAVKAEREQSELIEVSSSLPIQMTQLQMSEGSNDLHMETTASSQDQLHDEPVDGVREVSQPPRSH